MRASVVGLGYVGLVSSVCLCQRGIKVVGVDADSEKVRQINEGQCPIEEPSLEDLLRSSLEEGLFRATTAIDDAVQDSSITFICVGTPSMANGAPDSSQVFRAFEELGEALIPKHQEHSVVIRSTVFPGTTRHCREMLAGEHGTTPIYVGFNPEFLREGSAIADYVDPPFVVIGADCPEIERNVRGMYAQISAPIIVTDFETAELVKYACNAWHATKICFANEIGRIGDSLGINANDVMDILLQDRKLNVSDAYLRPGFAYGGSCLPKETRALAAFADMSAVRLPLLKSLADSNEAHVAAGVEQIVRSGHGRIGILGLTFKANTDDLRESPAISLAKSLHELDYQFRVFDPLVNPSNLDEGQRRYLETEVPQFSDRLEQSIEAVLEFADVIVVTQHSMYFANELKQLQDKIEIIDLSRSIKASPSLASQDVVQSASIALRTVTPARGT